MTYLLDTDTCIDLLRGRGDSVARARATPPEACAVSTVTRYELMTGAAQCRRPAQEQHKVETLCRTLSEMPFTPDAADQAALIRMGLERQGIRIGPYDLLLAGQAMAASLVLVTSNTREFSRVPGLKTESWRHADPL